jgi:hypothetical protein
LEHLSELTEPLKKLLKKNARWNWGEEQQSAFEQLLTSAPTLKLIKQNIGIID